VALGAFGAHVLKSQISIELMESYKTGALYHLVYSAVLIAMALTKAEYKISFLAFSFGIILFSGSLYVMAFTGIRNLGAITPIGGISFLIGWVFLVVEVLKNKSKKENKN